MIIQFFPVVTPSPASAIMSFNVITVIFNSPVASFIFRPFYVPGVETEVS